METFSPLVKPVTIQTVLTVAIMNVWDLHQIDVNNAFLQGQLSKTIYMIQPPSFKDLSKPDYMCQLRKAIYGLKQAPKAWYTALKNALIQLGFLNSKDDSSFFIFKYDIITRYLYMSMILLLHEMINHLLHLLSTCLAINFL